MQFKIVIFDSFDEFHECYLAMDVIISNSSLVAYKLDTRDLYRVYTKSKANRNYFDYIFNATFGELLKQCWIEFLYTKSIEVE